MKELLIILIKIENYASQITEFVGEMSFEKFCSDFKTLNASIFNLSQIGELVAKLKPEFIEETNHIPWRKIKGLRNKIVHDYDGIQHNMIWQVIKEFIPQLLTDVKKIVGKN